MYVKEVSDIWTQKQRHTGYESHMGWFDNLLSKYYHPDGRTCKNITLLEQNWILFRNRINVHGNKGVSPQEIDTEEQINFHCSSLNTKRIHGQVQLTQDFPKQSNV